MDDKTKGWFCWFLFAYLVGGFLCAVNLIESPGPFMSVAGILTLVVFVCGEIICIRTDIFSCTNFGEFIGLNCMLILLSFLVGFFFLGWVALVYNIKYLSRGLITSGIVVLCIGAFVGIKYLIWKKFVK